MEAAAELGRKDFVAFPEPCPVLIAGDPRQRSASSCPQHANVQHAIG